MNPALFGVVLLGLFFSNALAAMDGVYVGTVGTKPIVLKLEENDNRYYYRQYAKDIELERTERDGRLELLEIGLYSGPSTGKFELRSNAANLTGRWLNPKTNASLPVTLRRANTNDLTAAKLPSTPFFSKWRRDNPFDALRFDVAPRFVNTELVNAKRVQWWLEPKSGVRYPRLEGASKVVNDTLAQAHYESANNGLQCQDFEYDAKVALYSARVLSISATAYYDCGGAHPDGGPENFTLDLRTAKELRLEDVYRFAPLPANLDLNSGTPYEAYSSYIEARGDLLDKLVLEQHKSFTKNVGVECQELYERGDAFQFISWFLTPRGLVIQPSFPHVAAACEDDFELPYAKIKTYLAPNSPLR
jgi:hypothetical protein